MKYVEFKKWVKANGLTVGQLRCEMAGPTEAMLEVMDVIGLHVYERFVIRIEKEAV